MQSNTTGLSMEIFFVTIQCFLLGYLIARCTVLSKKVNGLQEEMKLLRDNQTVIDENLAGDLEGIEKALVLLSEKIQSLPDTLKDDIHRSSQAILERQDAAKPIKPNNWDSIKEAFKGPVRVEINERN